MLFRSVEQFIPTMDGGALAVGWITYPMNGGSSVFAMKIGPNDEFQTVVGNEPMLPLVTVESIDFGSVKVFPNPVNDILSIELNVPTAKGYLTDMQGKVLFDCVLQQGVNQLTVDSLNSGVYLLKIGGKTFKFLKF